MVNMAIILSLIIFVIVYGLIISEKVHRTTAAMLGAVLMFIVGLHFHALDPGISNIKESDIIGFVDFNTIGLLLGMMMIIGVLGETGFFEYLGETFLRVAGGRYWKMLVIFAIFTAIMSMFLDNTTTILLMVPLSFDICRRMEVNPVPIVITESVFSNIGGIGTLIGDPPNIMIGSASGLSFNEFIIVLMPIVVIVMALTVGLDRLLFFRMLAKYKNLTDRSAKVGKRTKDLVHKKKILVQSLFVLTITIVLFTLHDIIYLSPASVALIGASIVLLMTRSDPIKVLEKVEWTSLLFFASLFVMVGIIGHTGILMDVADWIMKLSGDNALVAGLLILWSSAIISAFVDNIPFTVTMIPAIAVLGPATGAGNSLWWMLALGVGLGGFATPIGATTGIITTGIAISYGHKITFLDWMKIGIPIMILSLTVSSLALILFPGLLR